MAYDAEVSRANPMCFVLLVDQSGSMADSWGGELGKAKADSVAVIVNRLLSELVISCSVGERVLDRFYVSAIGYGGNVTFALGGTLAGRDLVPLSEIANNPLRVEERTRQIDDGAGGLVSQTVKFPVWFEAAANGGTPMCAALGQAKTIIERWIADHPSSFPPEVFNITDGESTDGDPSSLAEDIRSMATGNGNVLLFNAHVSSLKGQVSMEFPSSEEELPNDQFAKALFRMSSVLPEKMVEHAGAAGLRVATQARGFVFNGTSVDLIRFLDIGTRGALR